MSRTRSMETEKPFRAEFSEDGSVSVEFSEKFLSLSHAEQVQALEAFLWRKTLEPSPTPDVDEAMAHHEITIILAESLLAKLRRGERIEKNADIEISIGDLMPPDDVVDHAVMEDMAACLEDEAEGEKGGS